MTAELRDLFLQFFWGLAVRDGAGAPGNLPFPEISSWVVLAPWAYGSDAETAPVLGHNSPTGARGRH